MKIMARMDRYRIMKIVSIICIIILISNILLFSFRVYDEWVMWGIIIAIAIIAFPGMNIMRKSSEKNAEHKKNREKKLAVKKK